MCMIATFLAK